MASQCLGRLTLDKKNIPESKFKDSKYGFFLPKRCGGTVTEGGNICADCVAREEKIPGMLEKWKGSMQNQGGQFHGRLTEPIPIWSRIYQGEYFQKMIDKGMQLDAETQQAADEAVAAAYKGLEHLRPEMPPKKKAVVEAPVPVPAPAPAPVKKPRTKKAIAPVPVATEPPPPIKKGGRKPKAKETTTAPVVAAPSSPTILETLNTIVSQATVSEPVIVVPPPAPSPKKNQPKRVTNRKSTVSTTPDPPILGIVNPEPIDPSTITVVKVKVRKTEIDGRTVYLQSEKDKVFDLKFKYLGRYDRSNDKIVAGYPDSEAEA